MRKIILLLLLPVLTWAQTVTISARNWGPDSAAADAAIADKFAAFLEANNATGDIEYVSAYEYTINDSAFVILDLSQDDPNPLKRYFAPTRDGIAECAVSPIWCTISRHSPAKKSYAKFTGWDGGPVPTGVKPLNKGQLVSAMAHAAKLRLAVDKDMTDGLVWKKNGKPLDKAAKRKAAWRVETGKDKARDYSKTK